MECGIKIQVLIVITDLIKVAWKTGNHLQIFEKLNSHP